jgi:hypothetical protein
VVQLGCSNVCSRSCSLLGENHSLVQDRAGWHTSKSQVTNLNHPRISPSYSPELQPAERLWCLVDEPLVNAHFEKIEQLEDVWLQGVVFSKNER